MCFNAHDWIVFLAGVQVFHTLSHMFLGMWDMLPVRIGGFTLTKHNNMYIIIINAVIAALLLWYAC
ncbi:MAG: hypothetical protein WCE21_02975 [Candidatus Babeliales bacterium]